MKHIAKFFAALFILQLAALIAYDMEPGHHVNWLAYAAITPGLIGYAMLRHWMATNKPKI